MLIHPRGNNPFFGGTFGNMTGGMLGEVVKDGGEVGEVLTHRRYVIISSPTLPISLYIFHY